MIVSALLRLALAGAMLCFAAACARQAPRKIVLIGGASSEGPARHAYADGVRVLAKLLAAWPGVKIAAYPDGWPDDPAALDGAATLVWYFDGGDRHALAGPARRARFAALMRGRTGLVALHQASTVPLDDDLGLLPVLGAVRHGRFDRTTESATLTPASAHPLLRGVGATTYRDEFYPTLAFADDGRVTPLLSAILHPQFRDGRAIVDDIAETHTVAWAYARAGGGRSFGYSGAHFLIALDNPAVRRLLLNAIAWSAGIDVPAQGIASGDADAATRLADAALHAAPAPRRNASPDVTTFHHDAARSGWHAGGSAPAPDAVRSGRFGRIWESPELDAFDGAPARLYASPLYVDRVAMTQGEHAGETFAAVIAATSNGFVYAINAARAGDVAAGRVLWRAALAPPCRLEPAPLDGVPTGVLATPVIDLARRRVYVTSCDPVQRWQAYALDLGSGAVLPGWPVRLDEATFNALNRNAGPTPVAPTRRFDFRVQRGALNLSADGARLYATFGESETGWIAAIDTNTPKVASAFAAVAMPHRGSGGIWGAGGAAVDADGRVYVATGSGFDGYVDQPHDWAQSVLALDDDRADGFALRGTYTPFNYCRTAAADVDLGSGGPILLPALDASTTSTSHLLAVGGKQGNVYLLDRAHLPGGLERRARCGTRASEDASLHAEGAGPLNVFAPLSDDDGALDRARSRSVPAYFRDESGASYLFVTGNTRAAIGSADAVPPSLVRLDVVASAGRPATLRIGRTQPAVVFGNPGSPVVSSRGARDAIVWVLDENARRSALLVGDDAPQPILYAFDATTLDLLWRSADGELATGGKYNEPVFANGQAIVGTDRVQAFGVGERLPARARRERIASATRAADSTATSPADGAAIFTARCAVCHEHASGNVPPRAWIAARPRAAIVDALTRGAMRAQAAGLRADEIDAVASYLTR